MTQHKKPEPVGLPIHLPPHDLLRLIHLNAHALDFLTDILTGTIDASLKERLDVVKLILAKTMPDAVFSDALKRQLSDPHSQPPQPQRLGVSGYDPDRI